MKAEFIALTHEDMERALDMMGRLYSEMDSVHDRERARRAAEGLLHNPEFGCVWMIEAEGKPAGYLCVTRCCSLECAGAYALLDELYIEAPWRRRGIGALAIAFAEEWSRAQGLAALRLEVGHQNAGALKLYERQGFQAHDRYLMTKWL